MKNSKKCISNTIAILFQKPFNIMDNKNLKEKLESQKKIDKLFLTRHKNN